MFGGLNRLLATAVLAAAVLVVPPAAFADGCGGGPSAVSVYKECIPGGGGSKPTTGSKGNLTSGQSGSSSISPAMAKALKAAGKDEKSLKQLVKAYGLRRVLESSHASGANDPTAIGSAFDLGSGPTVLLIILAGTAVLLLGAGGYRGIRSRRH